jgi:hypothetical protein
VKGLALIVLMSSGCSVGDRYLVAPATLAAIEATPAEQRAGTAAPAVRQKGGWNVAVRSDTFSLREAAPRPGGQVAIPTRMHSRRLVLANALVWTGTPISIAGLCMIIFGRDAVRWSGIALSAAAEPVMIAGTVIWVRTSLTHPQEVEKGRADMSYLPDPLAAPGAPRP